MEKYLAQLLADIADATENINRGGAEGSFDIWDWIPDDEEDRTAPRRQLEEWTFTGDKYEYGMFIRCFLRPKACPLSQEHAPRIFSG